MVTEYKYLNNYVILTKPVKKKLLTITKKLNPILYTSLLKLFQSEKYINKLIFYFIIQLIDNTVQEISPFSRKILDVYKNLIEQTDVKFDIEKICNSFNKLKEHQLSHILEMYNIVNLPEFNGVFVSDEMGLGKTFFSICSAKGIIDRIQNQSVLSTGQLIVISPKTIVKQWYDSCKNIFDDVSLDIQSDSKVIVTNYEQVDKFDIKKDSIVIIDEAHLLHNIHSERYKSIFNLVKNEKCKFVYLLSGTPFRESVSNLLSFIYLLSRYVVSFDDVLHLDKYLNDERMNKLILSVFQKINLRHTKQQVYDEQVGSLIIKELKIDIDCDKLRSKKLLISQINSQIQQDVVYLKTFFRRCKDYIKYINEGNEEIIKEKCDRKFIELYKKIISKENKLYTLKQIVWKRMIHSTLNLVVNNSDFKSFLRSKKKILIVSKSRQAIQHLYNRFYNDFNVVNIMSSDTSIERHNKIEKCRALDSCLLMSTYPIIESGINLDFIDVILIIDFPFRPHSFLQLIHRKQRMHNVSDDIIVYYLSLKCDDNIFDHHKNIFLIYYQKVVELMKFL